VPPHNAYVPAPPLQPYPPQHYHQPPVYAPPLPSISFAQPVSHLPQLQPVYHAPVPASIQQPREESEHGYSSSVGSSADVVLESEDSLYNESERNSDEGYLDDSENDSEVDGSQDIASEASSTDMGTGSNQLMDDLSDHHQEAWFAARCRARATVEEQVHVPGEQRAPMPRPSDEFFDQRPSWERTHQPDRPDLDYGVYTYNGQPNSGLLWPRMLLLNPEQDLGLCYFTFGTTASCPVGEDCRWSHTIQWWQLRFLITSGRVSLPRAQIMMQNWSTPEPPELVGWPHDHMRNIKIVLGSGPGPQKLKPIRKWTVPYANFNS